MSFFDFFLALLGGTTTGVIILGFLMKSLINNALTKEIEKFKSDLNQQNQIAAINLNAETQRENSINLESVKNDLLKQMRFEERQQNLEDLMKKYKGPLLHAVYDLQSRIYNIVVQKFTSYYKHGSKNQRDYVINNTMYVISQYFCWTEIIREEIQFLDHDDINSTRRLSDLRDKLYTLWQTDIFQDELKIWAGEQRAIGEIMIEHPTDRRNCIGYASFLKKIENGNESLLHRLKIIIGHLAENPDGYQERLIAIHDALIEIIDHLDPEFIRFPKEKRMNIK